MADEKEEFEETSDPELLDDEPETEWVGEEEWGDEEEENVALVEEEVPAFVDNGDGTISDTRANLMWKKDDSFKEYGYGINWFEAQDYSEILNENTPIVPGKATSRMSAQSVAHLLMVIFIILGNISYYLIQRRND